MQSPYLRFLCVSAIMCFAIPNAAQPQQLRWLESSTGCDASLRGLSVVDDQILWASGSNATVVRTVDGGKTWKSCGPQGFDKLEIRSIIAVDDRIATVASAGTPAVILQTQDAGQTWKEVFRHDSPAAFFDAMRFWDREHGIVFSDPVDGRILIATTADAGRSWQVVPPQNVPLSTEKEGGFAASNSVLCVAKDGRAWIGTGGTKSATSRIYATTDFGKSWVVGDCPLMSDTAAGVFSIVLHRELNRLVAVGGDYRPEAASATTAAFSRDLGKTWQLATQPPTAFVSAATVAKSKLLIATGPTSSFYSEDGDHWKSFSSIGFHATEVSPAGKVFAVGANGRFGVLDIQQ